MGADMLLHCAPACDLTPQRVKRIRQTVRAIPNDDPDLLELMQALGYEEPAEAKRQIIKNGLESQYEDRQITNLYIPGSPFVVRAAGGLSWGDPPSEAYTVLEHVDRCPQLWRVLEEFAREDALSSAASPASGSQRSLKLGNCLIAIEIREKSGMALLRDSCGQTYELHTDECHALTFQQLVEACHQALKALENAPTADVLRKAKQVLSDALAAVR